MKKIISVILAAFFMCGIAAGCNDNTPKGPGYINERDKYLNGFAEPLGASNVKNFDLDVTIDLYKQMNVKAARLWMHQNEYLSSPTTLINSGIVKFKNIIKKLKDAGIEHIIAMNHYYYYDGGFSSMVPSRDETANSEYRQFLEENRQAWETTAKAFPEITYWEVGNEMNHDPFLKPVTGNAYSSAEKCKIMTDYMYYATKGIKEGNPASVSVMPGLAPFGSMKYVEICLENIYKDIKSGNFPAGSVKSTNSDDYFDVLCWHPYNTIKFDYEVDEEWRDINITCYDVAKKYGDNGKKVVLSEFGFIDMGEESRDINAGKYLRDAYNYIKNDMPFVETLFSFRMYNDSSTAGSELGSGEPYYGFFTEPNSNGEIMPKKRAEVLCELYNGNLEGIYKYAGSLRK